MRIWLVFDVHWMYMCRRWQTSESSLSSQETLKKHKYLMNSFSNFALNFVTSVENDLESSNTRFLIERFLLNLNETEDICKQEFPNLKNSIPSNFRHSVNFKNSFFRELRSSSQHLLTVPFIKHKIPFIQVDRPKHNFVSQSSRN